VDVRLGIVGCGHISNAHGIAAQRIGSGVRFVACADIDEEAARRFATTYGSNAIYTDYVEMIENEDLDGIVLATWPAQHREQLQKAIEAGARFILCEKALALTGQEAVEIYDLAKERGTMIIEAFMYTHHPAIAALDRLIARPENGPVDSVRASFHRFFPEPEGTPLNWRLRKETGGSVPYDRASYAVNICGRYAGALPVQVSASCTVSKRLEVITRLYGKITYDNGCIGLIESSNAAIFSQEVQVTCADRVFRLATPFTMPGDATIYEYESARFAHLKETVHSIKSSLPLQNDLISFAAYTSQLQHFIDIISGNVEVPRPPLIESVVNSFVIDAMVRAGLEENVTIVQIPDNVRRAWLETRSAVR
jgi:predicted dehydrogenase